jgi:hypothetical protein
LGESRGRQHAIPPSIESGRIVSLQVADFKRVITSFHEFSRIFTPFPGHKQLVFRRLWNNHGLVESRENGKSEQRQSEHK